jgi:hypothetical protein
VSLIPRRPGGGDERSDRPEPRLYGEPTEEERLGRWEVRAAQWRAVELARVAFGMGASASLIGMRARGREPEDFRGLLCLDVPFDTLDRHREREARFMSMVDADPLLGRVPLVYAVGPSPEDADAG